MSTKLYDGLRLTAHAPDLHTVSRLVSQRMREVFNELALPIVAEHVALVMDNVEARSNGMSGLLGDYLVYRARQVWVDEQNKENPASVFHDPLRFSMVFGEVSDEAGTRRLAYHYAGNRAYEKALVELHTDEDRPIFADYHYQNQTDIPDDVSDEEWGQRRKDWDALLRSDDPDTDGTFGHLLMWQLPDTIRSVFDQAILGYEALGLNEIVTIEQRLRRSLSIAVASRRPLLEGFTYSDILHRKRLIGQALDTYLATEEGAGMPRPLALPLDLNIRMDQLPPVFAAPDQHVDAIVELIERRPEQ